MQGSPEAILSSLAALLKLPCLTNKQMCATAQIDCDDRHVVCRGVPCSSLKPAGSYPGVVMHARSSDWVVTTCLWFVNMFGLLCHARLVKPAQRVVVRRCIMFWARACATVACVSGSVVTVCLVLKHFWIVVTNMLASACMLQQLLETSCIVHCCLCLAEKGQALSLRQTKNL